MVNIIRDNFLVPLVRRFGRHGFNIFMEEERIRLKKLFFDFRCISCVVCILGFAFIDGVKVPGSEAAHQNDDSENNQDAAADDDVQV